MKLLPLLLCLLTFSTPVFSQAIALVQNGKVQIVNTSVARREYRHLRSKKSLTEAKNARLAALTASLGTMSSREALPSYALTGPQGRQWLDNEIRSCVRKPLQGRN